MSFEVSAQQIEAPVIGSYGQSGEQLFTGTKECGGVGGTHKGDKNLKVSSGTEVVKLPEKSKIRSVSASWYKYLTRFCSESSPVGLDKNQVCFSSSGKVGLCQTSTSYPSRF